MRRELLLATAGLAAFALLAGCENKKNNESPAPSPSAQSEEQGTGAAAKSHRAGRAGREATTAATAAGEISDFGFIKQAAISDMYEISASRMAVDRSNSAKIKNFARDMIDAHTSSTSALKGAIPPSAVSMLPADLDREHQEMIQRLRDANDQEFNRLYVSQQREAQAAAASLFRAYAKFGKDARLKQFAEDTLPQIKTQEKEVAQLETPKRYAQKSRKSSGD